MIYNVAHRRRIEARRAWNANALYILTRAATAVMLGFIFIETLCLLCRI